MLDRYCFGDATRIFPEAPVPIVCVVRSEERLGGAANVALNVASLGANSWGFDLFKMPIQQIWAPLSHPPTKIVTHDCGMTFCPVGDIPIDLLIIEVESFAQKLFKLTNLCNH